MAIIVDYSHALNRNLFMNLGEVKENYDYLAHLLVQQLLYFSKAFGASKVNPLVLALDHSSWRKQYYLDHRPKSSEYANQSYKGDRKKTEDIDWNKVYEIADDVAMTLKDHSDFYVIKVYNSESDDIHGVLSKYLKGTEEVFNVSGDKDMIQTQDDNVHIYDPIQKIYRPKVDVEEYKTLHFIQAGDDNIKAIKPRVGKKTAIKMLPELDLLLQTNPDMREKFEFNKNLIDFDCIPEEIQKNIIDEYHKQTFSYNPSALMKMCHKYKLAKAMENIQAFKLADGPIKTKLNQHFITAAINQQKASSSLEDFFSE